MDDSDKSGVVEDTSVEAAPEYVQKTQAEINEIVGRERFNSAEKVRRELEAKHKAEIEKLKLGETQAVGGMKGSENVDIDEIYQQVSTKMQADMDSKATQAEVEARQSEMQRVADTYFSKLKSGKDKYEDFDDVLGDFEHAAFPQLVHAVSGLENAADVMYELANSPMKLEKINSWLRNMPSRGLKELTTLSESIAQTNAATDEYQANDEPLSQVRPSNVRAKGGPKTLEDLKQHYRF